MKTDDLADLIIKTGQACVLLKLTQTRIAQLETAGFIARVGPGRWHLLDLVHGYVNFLKDETKRNSKTATLSRVQQARAIEIEQRTLRDSGALIAMADALALVDAVVGGLKNDLDGLPARCTRDMADRRKLETEVNEILTRAADRLEQEARLAQASGAPAPATAATVA